ncbi:hypothetical protein [Levilactobacillus brevis]|uniref:hypothetical protein n=1 Tax=Levilactobacillus brevis TaxID=1580 RepID=UPI00111AE31F|nr:hypothetical protein [Levilactobacillus brevis]QCZ43701.1 hypothetical protein UCCLBBS124_1377 [Levilactobacillus brevis]QCZ43773.1 hypothetical protein UCCLBBS124_1449 [Levilactobacillus brevis]
MAAIQGNGFKHVIHVNSSGELKDVLSTIMPRKDNETIVQRVEINQAVNAFRKATHKFEAR